VPAEASFGHAAADYAVELGRRAGAREVALFHHRPDRTDDALAKLVDRLNSPALSVLGAADGAELAL
jgi:phosphoribosyl 1,2-cyclic phosphodiesterase